MAQPESFAADCAGKDIAAGRAAVEAAWRRLAPQAAFDARFMDELFEVSYRKFERVNQVFLTLAVMAVSIAIVGLFGMATQMSQRRRHEIGVRKSIGARQGQIVTMLLRDYSRPVLIANLAVWPLGYLAAHAYLDGFTQRMELTLLPFVASLAVVVCVACAAVSGQALRAARAKPADVLRTD